MFYVVIYGDYGVYRYPYRTKEDAQAGYESARRKIAFSNFKIEIESDA